jgi:diguanylate cyclase (GGDEF)-like protein
LILDDLRTGQQDAATFTIRVADRVNGERHFEYSAVNLLDEPAINGLVLTARDVSDRVRNAEHLTYRATHDSLTGLANRSLFEAALEQHLGFSDPAKNESFAVVYLDLDAFKEVNDEFGHAVGDDILRAVGRVLQAEVRETDLAARVGGDEFAILLAPVSDTSHARAIATRLRSAVSAEIQRTLPDRRVIQSVHGRRPGASHGVAGRRKGDTVATICKRADDSLYRQKVRKR